MPTGLLSRLIVRRARVISNNVPYQRRDGSWWVRDGSPGNYRYEPYRKEERQVRRTIAKNIRRAYAAARQGDMAAYDQAVNKVFFALNSQTERQTPLTPVAAASIRQLNAQQRAEVKLCIGVFNRLASKVLEKYRVKLNTQIAYAPLKNNMLGVFYPPSDRIIIAPNTNEGLRKTALVHELGHYLSKQIRQRSPRFLAEKQKLILAIRRAHDLKIDHPAVRTNNAYSVSFYTGERDTELLTTGLDMLTSPVTRKALAPAHLAWTVGILQGGDPVKLTRAWRRQVERVLSGLSELRQRIRAVLRELRQKFPLGTVRTYRRTINGKPVEYQRIKTEKGWEHVRKNTRSRAKPVPKQLRRVDIKSYAYIHEEAKSRKDAYKATLKTAAEFYEEYTGRKVQPEKALRRILLIGGIRRFPRDTEVQIKRYDNELSVVLNHNRVGSIAFELVMPPKPPPGLAERKNLRAVTTGSERKAVQKDIYFRYASLERTGKKIGTKIFADMVVGAKRIGAQQIRLQAERNEVMNGYYTWVRLGANTSMRNAIKIVNRSENDSEYMPVRARIGGILGLFRRVNDDAKLPSGTPRRISRAVYRYKTLAEGVARSRIVRDWWRESGATVNLTFPIGGNSLSERILKNYVRRNVPAMNWREFNFNWGRD